MSSTSKSVIAIVVIALIGIAILWHSSSKAPIAQVQTASTTPTAAVATTSQAAVNPAADNSDASLDAGLSAVNGNMAAVDQDSTNADAGFNDKPVTQ